MIDRLKKSEGDIFSAFLNGHIKKHAWCSENSSNTRLRLCSGPCYCKDGGTAALICLISLVLVGYSMSYKRKCDPSTVLLSVEFGGNSIAGNYSADSGFKRRHRCNMAARLSWIFRLIFLCSGEKRSRVIHLYVQSMIRTHSGLLFQLNSTDVLTQMASAEKKPARARRAAKHRPLVETPSPEF